MNNNDGIQLADVKDEPYKLSMEEKIDQIHSMLKLLVNDKIVEPITDKIVKNALQQSEESKATLRLENALSQFKH